VSVVLMGTARPDASADSNAAILREWLAPWPVLEVPFLGSGACALGALKKKREEVEKNSCVASGVCYRAHAFSNGSCRSPRKGLTGRQRLVS